jgi:hypothetical protein
MIQLAHDEEPQLARCAGCRRDLRVGSRNMRYPMAFTETNIMGRTRYWCRRCTFAVLYT